MRKMLALVGLMGALPVQAADFAFRGQWEVRFPDPQYLSVVLIDGERRVTADSPKDQGRPAKFFGYVALATDSKMEIHLTDKTGVVKTFCDIRTPELLHCYAIRAKGTRSDNFIMVKVGPGPHRLTQPSQ